MRIRQIDVDRFRIWRNLTLPLDRQGWSVFYGPNEAGKTTLMRFVRAVLYGFEAEDTLRIPGSRTEAPWHGSIFCEHRGHAFQISRSAAPGTRGEPQITGFRKQRKSDRQLRWLLDGTTEDVFEDIFAIGVKELQQLATMESSAVADRLYGLSMGPEGRTLLNAIGDVQRQKQRLLDTQSGQGVLPALFGEYETLISSEPQFDDSREKHAALCREREGLDSSLERLTARKQTLENSLQGHRYLQRCWPLWNRTRVLQKELGELPLGGEVPDELFDEIKRRDKEIADATRVRDQLQAAVGQLRQQVKQAKLDQGLERNSAAVESLVDQADWLADIEDRIRTSAGRLDGSRKRTEHRAA